MKPAKMPMTRLQVLYWEREKVMDKLYVPGISQEEKNSLIRKVSKLTYEMQMIEYNPEPIICVG